MLAGLAAVSRVSRALVAPDELPVLASTALEEMREALHLDRAVLYLPDADGQPVLRRFVGDAAAQALSFDEEAWQLATNAPIVLRESAGWLVDNPFDPPATDWLILPLIEGVVIASAPARIALDALSGTVLSLLCSQLSAGITTARLRRELQAAAIERERRQLTAEVHDGLAQYLAVARRELALAEPDRARLTEAVESAHRLVRERLRTLSHETPASLRAALEAAARRARTPVRVSGHGDAGPEAVTLAARVVSEALANADAHAHATSAQVTYAADDERLELTVRDDGRGFDPAHAAGIEDGHLGLTVMRERARGQGGDCTVTSTPGTGTEVHLWIPL
ncbi:sensor histidine kinase [Solirubrobacter deserti]|uniref:sensor histidine kinase n=1 Tax=Solirubrobacter deserti TaxID=2282478 RepID=UPI0022CD964B|nr:ATP-binding protein [Solirubrobacter deserti]